MRRQLSLFGDAPAARAKGRRGRRPRDDRHGFVPHRTRPFHSFRHPVHVSMRCVANAPNLRHELVTRTIERQLGRWKARGVRVVHYSIQHDHLHLMIEGADRFDLSNQMRNLFSRIAMAVNVVARRRGRLFRDRHHRHDLATPSETRRALVYILFNGRKHGAAPGVHLDNWLDVRSSTAHVTAWHPEARPPPDELAAAAVPYVVTAARTWLAQRGWQRAGGPLRFDEHPRRRL